MRVLNGHQQRAHNQEDLCRKHDPCHFHQSVVSSHDLGEHQADQLVGEDPHERRQGDNGDCHETEN